MRRATALAAVLLGACSLGGVAAGTLHCLAEPIRADPGDEVLIHLMTGTPFEGKPRVPAAPALRLLRLWSSGRTDLDAKLATPTTPGFRAEQPGVQLVASLPANDPDAARQATSFCKALIVIGDARPGETIWRSELGQRLEIVPRTDPAGLIARGGSFELQVLFDREPLIGASVAAVSRLSGGTDYRSAATDTSGVARFDLDTPGQWLVFLAHKSLTGPRGRGSIFESSLSLTVGPRAR